MAPVLEAVRNGREITEAVNAKLRQTIRDWKDIPHAEQPISALEELAASVVDQEGTLVPGERPPAILTIVPEDEKVQMMEFFKKG